MMANRTRHRRRTGERAQVITFIVVITTGLIALAGLVDDGGRALSARLRAMDEAQSAARAGAEQIDVKTLRESGRVTIDSSAAVRAAQQYLAATGDAGDISVAGDAVHVVVRTTVPTQILAAFGLGSLTVSGTGDARAEPTLSGAGT